MTRSQAREELGRRFRVSGVAALNRAREQAAKDPVRQKLRQHYLSSLSNRPKT